MAPALARRGRRKGKCVFRKLMAASTTWRTHPAASRVCVITTFLLSPSAHAFCGTVVHVMHEHLSRNAACANAPFI